MKANTDIHSMDAILDEMYGKVGTPERDEFRREAYMYCAGQMIHDARKQEKMTQDELAIRTGTSRRISQRNPAQTEKPLSNS